MKYIIMCGGHYQGMETPKQTWIVGGEPIVVRTIRLLREAGVEDIAISSNDDRFEQYGVPVLRHINSFDTWGYDLFNGYWIDAFYPTLQPVCYIFGDVVFSKDAIKKIVKTETDDIQFFASAPPFDRRFPKTSAEPFALKVVNGSHLWEAIRETKRFQDAGYFKRKPIMWELWQVIKHTPLNIIDYTNYCVINDWTCDVDGPGELKYFERVPL